MKTNTRKLLAALLAVVLTLSMALTAYAATVNYGTVTVNSKYSDTSVKQATLNAGTGWTTPDGVKINGTLTITFPQGYYYGTPTAEEIWQFVANGYNANHGTDNSGDNGNGNQTVVTRTAAQQEAERVLKDVQEYGEAYGWCTVFSPSTTTTATEDGCWYKFASTLIVVNGNNFNLSEYDYAVRTSKNATGTFETRFKVYKNGQETVSMTADEVKADLAKYGAANTTPYYLVKTSSAQGAVQGMQSLLQQRGYTVTLSNTSYVNNNGTATVKISKSGYTAVTYYLTVTRIASGNTTWYRCTFADGSSNCVSYLGILTQFGTR